ncbi:hypothetical protein Tco_0091244 [Tanacetum coccineum]
MLQLVYDLKVKLSGMQEEIDKLKRVFTIVGLAMGSLKTPGSKNGVMMLKRAVAIVVPTPANYKRFVNPSTSDELKGDINNEDYEDVGDEGLDKLCEEMSNISVSKVTAKFTRKHTRFVYNSDGELAGELESSSKTEEERVNATMAEIPAINRRRTQLKMLITELATPILLI